MIVSVRSKYAALPLAPVLVHCPTPSLTICLLAPHVFTPSSPYPFARFTMVGAVMIDPVMSAAAAARRAGWPRGSSGGAVSVPFWSLFLLSVIFCSSSSISLAPTTATSLPYSRGIPSSAAHVPSQSAANKPPGASDDPRNASNPWGTIYSAGNNTGYSDQPQIITLNSSYWLCVVTCSPGHEGQRNQIAAVTVSRDGGRNWSYPPVSIEPLPKPPLQRIAASWINPLYIPGASISILACTLCVPMIERHRHSIVLLILHPIAVPMRCVGNRCRQ